MGYILEKPMKSMFFFSPLTLNKAKYKHYYTFKLKPFLQRYMIQVSANEHSKPEVRLNRTDFEHEQCK